MKKLAILGVGNILEKDDGIGIYASYFIAANYTLSSDVEIIHGGVEGINLLPLLREFRRVVILDAIASNESAGSIFHIPIEELRGRGLSSATAHEIGVIECFDMLELMGETPPNATLLAIVPKEIAFEIGLSHTLHERFSSYIEALLGVLKELGIDAKQNATTLSLGEIIEGFRNPRTQ